MMVLATFSIRDEYWEEFELQERDVELIYNHLLEVETPLTPREIIEVLIAERIQHEIRAIEEHDWPALKFFCQRITMSRVINSFSRHSTGGRAV